MLISLFTDPIVKYILFLFVIGPIMHWHTYYFTQLLFKLIKRRNEKYIHSPVFNFGLRISFSVFSKAIYWQEIFSIFIYLRIFLFYLHSWKVVLLITLFWLTSLVFCCYCFLLTIHLVFIPLTQVYIVSDEKIAVNLIEVT